jgi:hypothetical protein
MHREVIECYTVIPDHEKPRVAMLEWIDPLFNAGHWTPELVVMAGGVDCLGMRVSPPGALQRKICFWRTPTWRL